MPRGKLISFEGIDGCGKSTQAELVESWLRSKGLEVKLLREPGGTPLGEAVREILLAPHGSAIAMDGLSEYLLFAASRAELTRKVIKPLLDHNHTVILDRYADSSLAYQGYGHGVELDLICRVNELATGGLKPDLTILLDIDPAMSLSRIKRGSDRIERYGLEFFTRVRNGFITLAEAEPERFRVIDAARDIETITRQIAELLAVHFDLAG